VETSVLGFIPIVQTSFSISIIKRAQEPVQSWHLQGGVCALLFVVGFLIGVSNVLGRSHTLAFLVPIIAGYALLGYLPLVLTLAPKPLIIRRVQRSRWQRRDTAIALCAAALVLSLILPARLQDPARADVLAAIAVVTAIVFGITSWYAGRAARP
jgi:hypothetical protein